MLQLPFLTLRVCNQATVKNTFDEINAKIKIYYIHWKHVLAFSRNNASVMLGKNNSVFQRIAGVNPGVYPVGCACHLGHICAKKAAKKLSIDVEQLVIDLY